MLVGARKAEVPSSLHAEKGLVTMRWVRRTSRIRFPLGALLLSLVSSGCSKEERAASALAELGEAYTASELGSVDKFTEFTARYQELTERYSGTQAAMDAEKWLMTGTSAAEEEAASAELAALKEAYSESDLGRTEKNEEFTPKYQTLAEDYWGTDAALEAKFWVMRRAPRDERSATIGEDTDAIFERYGQSLHIKRLGELITNFSEEQREEYFGELRENSPHPEVRAAAIYDLARYIKRFMRYGMVEDSPENREKADSDLRLLMEEYADVPKGGVTYGVMADAVLNAYTDEDLAIGQPAPEIVGVTADGDEIRLSQFLGKVVVIDFWGDW